MALILTLLSAANLLWPTSLPLQFNGAPLNRYPEFAALLILLSWIGLVAAYYILQRVGSLPHSKPLFPKINRQLSWVGVALGILLLLCRFASPLPESFTACYTSPERPQDACLPLVDSWPWTSGGRSAQMSRFEEQIMFHPAREQNWRISAFNDRIHNLYGHPPGSKEHRRQEFRKAKAHPFTATFSWKSPVGQRLTVLYPERSKMWVTYRGSAALITPRGTQQLAFSREVKTTSIPISAEELETLRLQYANFTCADAACLANLTMTPLPIAEAVFEIRIGRLDETFAQARPLNLQLLAGAEPVVAAARWAPVVELLFLLVLLLRFMLWLGSWLQSNIFAPVDVAIVAAACCITWGIWFIASRGEETNGLENLAFALIAAPAVLGLLGTLKWFSSRFRVPRMGSVVLAFLLLHSMLLSAHLPALLVAPLNSSASNASPWAMPSWDESMLMQVGDDPLTYAGWGKLVLDQPQRFTEPTVVLSKPLFIYSRALFYMVFGDGEIYGANFARQMMLWIAATGSLLVLHSLTGLRWNEQEHRMQLRASAIAVAGILVWLWLSYSIVRFAAPYAVARFSEAPSWAAALVSFFLLLGSLKTHNNRLILLAGVLMGISVMLRMTSLPLTLVGIGIVGLGKFNSWRNWLRTSTLYVAPVMAALILIWLHAGAPLSMPPGVREYAAANAGLPTSNTLIPTKRELAVLILAAGTFLVALSWPSHLAQKLRLAALGVALVVGGFLPLIPQLSAPYYPRALMLTYYVLSLMPPLLLLYCHHISNPAVEAEVPVEVS